MTDHISGCRSAADWLWACAVAVALALFTLWFMGCTPQPAPVPDAGDSAISDTTAGDSMALDTVAADTLQRADTLQADTLQMDQAEGELPEFTPEDTAIVAALPRPPLRATRAGLPYGLSAYPSSKWCDGRITNTIISVRPAGFLSALRAAKKCNMSVFVVTARPLYQNSNKTFSASKYKAALDEFRRDAPPDSLKKYTEARVLLGWRLFDDVNCTECWGGSRITQRQTEDVFDYARAKYPRGTVALGSRVIPTWYAQCSGCDWSPMDFAWAQAAARFLKNGSLDPWYDTQEAAAKRLGVKLGMGMNVTDWQNSRWISASVLKTQGTRAVNGYSCAFSSWWYESNWRDSGRGTVWDALFSIARSKPTPSCLRGS